MRKLHLGLLCLAILAFGATAAQPARALVASIVLDASTGAVLHQRNADQWHYPASLTKIMTLYLAFDAIKLGRVSLDETITVSAHAAAQPPSSLNLRRGDTITVRDAISALSVRSANDVAAALAEHLGGSEAGFAHMMTRKARHLGMERTTFRNASGLPNTGQRTTAREMAILALAMMRNHGDYYRHFATQEFRWKGTTYRSHNALLRSYDGADGMKTGYIRAAGFNLIASAVRNGRRIIAVGLGGNTGAERNRDVAALLDRGFQRLNETGVLARRGTAGPSVPGVVAHALADAGAVRYASGPATPTPRPWNAAPAGVAPVRVASAADVVPRPAPDDVPVPAPAPGGEPGMQATGSNPSGSDSPSRWSVPIPLIRSAAAAGVSDPAAAGPYAIQVGAFRSSRTAQRIADTSLALLDAAPDGARAAVLSGRSGNGNPIHRARIVGLDRSAAERSCNALKRRDRDCLVVRNDDLASQSGEDRSAASSG